MAAVNIIEREPVSGALGVSGAGIISTCLDTTAHPLSFTPVGIISPAGALQYIAFSNDYDTDGILYVGDSAGGVFRVSALGVEQLDLTVAPANFVAAATGIACTADGTLYVSGMGAQVDNDGDLAFNEDWIDGVDNDADGLIDEDPADNGAVWRTMNPTESPVIPGFEPQWVALSWGLLPSAQLGGIPLALPPVTAVTGLETISGSNVLFSVNVGNDLVGLPAAPALVVKHTLAEFTDTLVTTVPTLVSPASGSTNVGTMEQISGDIPRVRVEFEWAAVAGAHTYTLQVDTDPMFHNAIAVPLPGYTENVNIIAPETTYTSRLRLLPEEKYYWRVQVAQWITTAGTSPWSAVWSLKTPPGTAGIAPEILGPEHGQQNVGIEDPCFTWG
ncbi:MAG: hypothetical protein KAX26_06060, partial [Anaerolineae bacterium]|nr:hypothetical protein [Anaerolineae bacterium]